MDLFCALDLFWASFVLFWVISIVLSYTKEGAIMPDNDYERYNYCPNCGCKVMKDALYCMKCGTSLIGDKINLENDRHMSDLHSASHPNTDGTTAANEFGKELDEQNSGNVNPESAYPPVNQQQPADRIDNVREKGNKSLIDKAKVKQVLILVALCSLPLLLIAGIRSGRYIQCTSCGDDTNRLFIYAQGNYHGIKYKSCVGPAGIIGCGLNTRCWPTECVKVELNYGDDEKLTGCVSFYNGFGCIDKSDVKSYGKYKYVVSCEGINCQGYEYREKVGETTEAKQRDRYFGCDAKEWERVDPKKFNSGVPRSFTKGCWKHDD